MRRLHYLDSARRDIAEIYAYIEGRSESSVTAGRFISRLRAQCQRIAELHGTIAGQGPNCCPDYAAFHFRAI